MVSLLEITFIIQAKRNTQNGFLLFRTFLRQTFCDFLVPVSLPTVLGAYDDHLGTDVRGAGWSRGVG